MSKRKSKEPRTEATKPKEASKYARKIQRRRQECRKLGIADIPYPVLNSTNE